MVCKEYFPSYTHSDCADCKNCKYNGRYTGCSNVNVRVALSRKKEETKRGAFGHPIYGKGFAKM